MSTPLLRLTQTSIGKGRCRVEVSLEVPGQARQTATCTLKFELSDQDREDLRWYLEDYREAIRHFESAGNSLQAAGVRFSSALVLFKLRRFVDAMDYARSAMRGYSAFGATAEEEIRKSEGLIVKIQQQLTSKG